MKSTLNKRDILEEAGCSCIVNGGVELKGPFNLYYCSVQHGTKGAAVAMVQLRSDDNAISLTNNLGR